MSSLLRQDWIERTWILRKIFQHDNHVWFSLFLVSVYWVLLDSIIISSNNN